MSQLALSASFEYLQYVIVFRRQNKTALDVRLWRLKTAPALKGLKNRTWYTDTNHYVPHKIIVMDEQISNEQWEALATIKSSVQ